MYQVPKQLSCHHPRRDHIPAKSNSKLQKLQESINNSRKEEDERVIQRNWTSDIPFLCLYHTLTDDSLQAEFAHSFCVKTTEELDGSKSGFFSNYYEMAANKFSDKGWIPYSIALPDLHPGFTLSKKLYLNVSLITGKKLQDKLTSAQYKMVKVINDWERSGEGHGMAVEDLEGEGVYKFINRDDRKNFLKER